MADKNKQAFVIKDFKDENYGDSGTQRHFTAGSIEPVTADEFKNYEHAGLVRVATADDKAAAKPTA